MLSLSCCRSPALYHLGGLPSPATAARYCYALPPTPPPPQPHPPPQRRNPTHPTTPPPQARGAAALPRGPRLWRLQGAAGRHGHTHALTAPHCTGGWGDACGWVKGCGWVGGWVDAWVGGDVWDCAGIMGCAGGRAARRPAADAPRFAPPPPPSCPSFLHPPLLHSAAGGRSGGEVPLTAVLTAHPGTRAHGLHARRTAPCTCTCQRQRQRQGSQHRNGCTGAHANRRTPLPVSRLPVAAARRWPPLLLPPAT